jgi:thiamine pyrophosphokinase
MPNDINFQQYKSIIALNGNITFRHSLPTDVPLIATDGASDKLVSIGITPDIVIGDLDSLQTPSTKSQIIHIPNQDQCDFEKALQYCHHQHLLPILVIGVEGNELDHVLNNLALISQYKCDFLTSKLYGKTLSSPETLSIHTTTKVSILPMPSAHVSTQGLTWELTNHQLSFPKNISLSNRVKDKFGEVEVVDGQVIVFIHF